MCAETNAELLERVNSLADEVKSLRSRVDEIKVCPMCEQLFIPRKGERDCYMCRRGFCHSQMQEPV